MINSRRLYVLLPLLLALAGCGGESTKDAMLRMAKERAARNRAAEEEAEKKSATPVVPPTADVANTQASPPTPPANAGADTAAKPAQPEAKTQASTPPKQDPAPAKPGPTTPIPAKPAPTPANAIASKEASSSSEESTSEYTVARKTWISPDGKLAASIVSEDTVEVFDVASKKSMRKFFTADLKPVSIAFAEDRILVGTHAGGIKHYDLVPLEGLDEFSKKRQLRLEAESPRRIHSQAVTLLSASRDVGVSADAAGQLRFWSTNPPAVQSLTGLTSPPLFFRSFQGDRVVFSASEDGSVNFWQRSEDGLSVSAVRPYGKVSGRPVAMETLPDGKGLAVVDERGALSISLPTADGVSTSMHQLSESGVVDLSFARNGQSLVYASRSGRIVEQTLPFPEVSSFSLGSVRPSFVNVVDSRLLLLNDDNTLDVFTREGKPLKRFHLGAMKFGRVTAATLSTDEAWLIVGDQAGSIHFISFATERLAASLAVSKGEIANLLPGSNSGGLVYHARGGEVGSVVYPTASSFVSKLRVPPCGNILSVDPAIGIVATNPSGDSLVYYPLEPLKKQAVLPLANLKVTAASLSDTGVIVGTAKGKLFRWAVADNEPGLEPLAQTTAGQPILTIGRDGEGKLLIADQAGSVARLKQSSPADNAAQSAENEKDGEVEPPGALEIVADFKTTIAQAAIVNGRIALASGSVVAVLDDSGRRLDRLPTDGEPIVKFSLSAEGHLAAVDAKGRLWSKSDKPPQALPSEEAAIDVHWTDGTRYLIASQSRLYLWDADSGEILLKVPTGTSTEGIIADDAGLTLVHGSDGSVEQITAPNLLWKLAEAESIRTLAVAPGQERVVVATGNSQLWNIDLSSGTIVNDVDLGAENCDELVYQPSLQRMLVAREKGGLFAYEFGAQISELPGGPGEYRRSYVADPSSDVVFAIDSEGQVAACSTTTGEWQPLATHDAVQKLAWSGGANLLGLSAEKTEMLLLPIQRGEREIHRSPQGILSFDWAANDRVGAFVDGSAELNLLSAVDSELTKTITIPETRLMLVRLDPAGDRVIVAGQRLSGEYFVEIRRVEDASVIRQLVFQEPIRYLDIGPDGIRFGAVTAQGTVAIFSKDGLTLEDLPEGTCESSFAFNTDATKILYASADSNVRIHPLSAMAAVDLGEETTESIDIMLSGMACLSAAEKTLMLIDRDGSELAVFVGSEGRISDTAVSADGKLLAAVSDLASGGKVTLWEIPEDLKGGVQVGAKHVVSGEQPVTTVAFSQGAKYLLLAGNDGTIRGWSIADQREVARFVGHEGSIEQVQPQTVPSKFVSLGADKSLRSWTFPEQLPGPEDPIPEGAMVASSALQPSTEPVVSKAVLEEDPLDTARRALFSGSGREQAKRRFFSELEGDLKLKEAAQNSYTELERLKAGVATGSASPDQLAIARKRFSQARRELLPLSQADDSTSLVDDHANLLFSAKTDFIFGGLRTSTTARRPVKLRISDDRFVYAARASEPYLRDEDNNQSEHEPGHVLSWDFGYSGIQAYSWTFPELNLSDVYSSPNNDGIFTGPNLKLFADDGHSRTIATGARCWSVSSDSLSSSERLMAIGKSGPIDGEGAVLQIYKATALSKQTAAPTSSFAAFDGVVTAIAFGNRHPWIAFSMRDRTTTKVFIADPLTLAAGSFKLVFQHNHLQPYRGVGISRPVPGVLSLAFSPNDDVLVAHGQFEKPATGDDDSVGVKYVFKGWLVEWQESEIAKTSKAFDDFESDQPLLDDGSPLALRFMQGVDFSMDRYLRLVSKNSRRAQTSASKSVGDLRVIFETGNKANVYSLLDSKVLTEVNLYDAQRGKATYSITQDGRWMIVGNGQGNVAIWDMLTGKKHSLSLNGRPCHTGPVVGAVLSETNPKLGIPEFAATAGEENRIKVWDLISVLQPELAEKPQ